MCATSPCLYPISSFATRLASASVAMYVSYEGLASNATVCIVHYLVGCVYDARHVAAFVDSLVCKSKAAELVQVRFEELQVVLEQIEPLAV